MSAPRLAVRVEVEDILEKALAGHRYSLLMALSFILLIAVSLAVSAQVFSFFSVIFNLFVWGAFIVSLGVGYLASRMVPDTPPEKSGSWLVDMLAAGSYAVFTYSVLSGQAGLFYGVVIALSLLALLLTKPRFTAVVEPVVNGALTGFVSFVVVLLLSALLTVAASVNGSEALRASVMSVMQVDPVYMVFLVALPEELWARAWLISGMRRHVGFRVAVFWSTVLFVALHIPSRIVMLGVGTIMLPVVIGLIGLAMLPIIYVYSKYCEHPLFSITAHTVYNSMLVAVSYGDVLYFATTAAFLFAVIYVLRLYGKGVVKG